MSAAARPVIGITAGVEQAQWRAWHQEALLSPRNYALAVQRAGGLALLLSPDELTAETPAELFAHLDGLVVAGGSDIGPVSYGGTSHERTSPGSPERDRFEIALARAALEHDLPLLGICRGMQIMNVACGGDLVQHLPDVIGSERHSHTAGAFSDHEVRLDPDSLAARAAGGERIAVKSHHHQALATVGEGLMASGWAVPDDVVEAIERPDRRFALGVLWHPEEHADDRVVGAFVAATAMAAVSP